jgi:hypothetical protein
MSDRIVLTPVPSAGSSRRRQRYELVRSYTLCLDLSANPHDHVTVRVPARTETDFASVPRWLSWLYPPDGPWASAAVVHDYLYQRGECDRFLADAVFRAAMVAVGVPWWRAAILFYAVRLFGRRCFRTRTPS